MKARDFHTFPEGDIKHNIVFLKRGNGKMVGKIISYAVGMWAILLIASVVAKGIPINVALSNMLSPFMIIACLAFGVVGAFLK
ncbi:MAG: hypothetical protein FJ135_12490 [Deltaproteobacteria bacterium]|nr:hypothetical protein [Deltaproteobacteria bacterium]